MAEGIDKRWAFLVGINHYYAPSYPDLEFCVDDVKALAHLLEQDLGYEKVVLIYDDPPEDRYQPTAGRIAEELKLLCDLVGPNDLLLVHFACHGLRLEQEPYLITSETAAHNPKRYALSVAGVEQMMRDSGARCKVLLLDACHTGVEMGRDLADPEFLRHVYEQAEGFAVIAASTAQQKAYEFGGNGLFTHHLLQALSGKADLGQKGFVSVKDVENYVLHQIKSWNQETAMVQTPTSKVEGFGDMVLAHYPTTLSSQLPTNDANRDAAPRPRQPPAPSKQVETSSTQQKYYARRLASKQEELAALEEDLDSARSGRDRLRIEREIESLLEEIAELEGKLNS